jgi:osmotically-inducible protein OsmY
MGNRDFGERVQRHFGNVVDLGGRMDPASVGTSAGRSAIDDERGPHWGKGPKGYKRNDERTREDVCDAIAFQGHIDASDVEVKVESGVVTLSGTVALREHKRALERLVERCRGVHEVRNELRLVREAPPPTTTSGSSMGNPRGRNARA